MKKSILLITGAGGWLGSTLIEMLSKNGISNTYDLIKWDEFDSHLSKDEFKYERLTQYHNEISDISCIKYYVKMLTVAPFRVNRGHQISRKKQTDVPSVTLEI